MNRKKKELKVMGERYRSHWRGWESQVCDMVWD